MRLPARLMWLAAAISIAAAAVPAVAGADPTSCQPGTTGPTSGSAAGGVTVHVTAGKAVAWCSSALIAANSDIPDGTDYPLQATSQSPSYNPVSNAISVNKLLTLAGLNPATVGFTYVTRANGTWSTLSTADVSAQPPFQNALKPIVWLNGSETDYMRPQRSSTDVNAEDFITAQGGAAVDLFVSAGPLLEVAASASPTSVQVNQSVTFTATVANQTAADGTVAYNWSFQDGSSSTGASVTHSFTAAGTYYPLVYVKGPGNDSGGVSQPVAVTVGSLTLAKGSQPGKRAGSNRNKHAPSGGPARSRGKQPGSTPSRRRNSGSAAKKKTPSNSRTPASHGNSGTADATTSPQATTPHTTNPPQARTTPAATKSPVTRRRLTAHRQTQPQPSPGTTVVRGRLISDVITVPAAQLASQNKITGNARAPSARLAGGSVTPLAGIAAGGVVLLLLGAGAGVELRAARRSVSPARTA
jgi:hypothetical protein